MVSASVMGVDLGTQSIKVLVYDPAGKEILALTSEPLPMESRADGTREQDAATWISAFHTCVQAIPKNIKVSVKAIAVSGQQHGFVPVGDDGSVLAPVKLWCDTATGQEAEDIIAAVGGHTACRNLTGNTVPVGFTASKIRWLKNHHPEIYAKLSAILLPHDFLNFHLSGRQTMEYGDASGTGFFDVRERCWSKDLLQAVDPERDLTSCLPRLIGPSETAGTIRADLAEELGLPQDTIIAAGGGDNMMAAIGTGNVAEGELTASLGTSGTLFAYSSSPLVDSGGDLAAFCSSTGGWLPLGCTMNCTVATEQIRSLLGVSVSDMEKIASEANIGSGGIITLPFYQGERMPDLPGGKAVLYGLDTDNTTKGNLVRSAMEAAAFGLKTALNAFTRNGMRFSSVTLTGGGSNSPLWRQICADVLQLPVKTLNQQENAAFGAALQALWCLENQHGNTTPIEAIVSQHLSINPEGTCQPDPDACKSYTQIYQQYQTLVSALTPIFETA